MLRRATVTTVAVLIEALAFRAFAAAPAVDLTVTDYAGVDRVNEPVTTGVPFGKGVLKDVASLTVTDATGQWIPSQFRKLSAWPDGSVRWALMDCQVTVKANASVALKVVAGTPSAPPSPVKVEDTPEAIKVSTGPLAFVVSKTKFNLFQSLTVNQKELIGQDSPGLVLYPGAGERIEAHEAPREIKVEEAGPLRTVILVRGVYPKVHNGLLRYTVRITAYAGRAYLGLRAWLENHGSYGYTGRAEWYKFDGQSIELDLALGALSTALLDGAAIDPVPKGGALRVAQHNPPNNWDGFRYTVTADGQEVKTGARTDGLISLAGADGKVTVGVRHFWENYSKAIELDGPRLKLWLWPTDGEWPPKGNWRNRGGGDFMQFRQPGYYHIPGSVHKGHDMILDFEGRVPRATAATLRSPLMAMASADYYATTEAAPGWFAPASFKSGDAAYDAATAVWDKIAMNGADPKAPSSIWNARQGRGYIVANWYGWMNFGDLGWGGGMSSLHYDWTWIMLLNYLRQGYRGFFDLGATMAKHLIDVDHLWSTRNDPMLQKMARFEFAEPFIHGGVGSGHCKPTPTHTWVSGIVLYYMLTGDPVAYECALSHDEGLTKRLVSRLEANPTADGQARGSSWAILCYCALYEMTGEQKYLDKALSIFRNSLKLKWKEKGPYLEGGLQYYYGTQALCELQHLSGDPEVMQMLVEACQRGDFSDQYAEWRVFLSNIYAYVGYKTNNPDYIQKAKELWMAYTPPGAPNCFTGSGAWTKETGKYLRNGHILQYVLWKNAKK